MIKNQYIYFSKKSKEEYMSTFFNFFHKRKRGISNFLILSMAGVFLFFSGLWLGTSKASDNFIKNVMKPDVTKVGEYNGRKPTHISIRKAQEGWLLTADMLKEVNLDIAKGRVLLESKSRSKALTGDWMSKFGGAWVVSDGDDFQRRVKFIEEI